jgi:hypothetical protein
MVAAAKGLEVDVVDDRELGRRGSGDWMVERPRGYLRHYQHVQHVRDIVVDVHHDVGVDVVEVVGSLGIGVNVWPVAEMTVTGGRP